MRRLALLLIALLLAAAVGPPVVARLLGWGPDPSLRPARGRTVAIGNGLELNVVEVGNGPPVVMVHGLPSCAYDWALLPQKLAAYGYRVIAYDRIGYGYSSRSLATDDRYTYESNARDLGALLDALKIENAALVGWSYGGAVVQTVARRAPERVSHLVLVAAVGPAQPEHGSDALSRILASPAGSTILNWVGSVPPLSRRMTGKALVQAFARADAIPARWTEYTRAMLALPGTVEAFVLEAQRGRSATLQPEALRVPTLILQGSSDYLVPPQVADDLHHRMAGSDLVMIPDGSHMLPVTHADLLAEKIHIFLSREQKPGSAIP
jgi:pimeloyl-ACP methyl ester carboxylesterase